MLGRMRELKGKSKLELLETYTIIDTETTGLSVQYDEIIEIAAIKVAHGNIVDRWHTLVKPNDEISDFISELTGITNKELEGAPEICDALPEFLNFIKDDIIIGHNVNFDINFIYDYCEDLQLAPFKNDFIDTLRLSRRVYTEFENHKLDTITKNLGVEGRTFHRSLSDCEILMHCYERMKSDATINNIDLSDRRWDWKASDLKASTTDFNEEHPLYKKYCVFTGALERMARKDAMQIVLDAGGQCGDSVNRKTDYLILGNLDYCSSLKGKKSSKWQKAEKQILEGYDIKIIPENVFYDMIENN